MLVAIVVVDLVRPVSPEQRLRALRRELRVQRAAADSCLEALRLEESALRSTDEKFDSLRAVIEGYEELDPRGVPADSYDAYIDAFNAYNEAIPAREEAGETLQVNWAACREIVAMHNQLADSARALAEELGVINDAVRRVPSE
ncbi:MAG: hypothetical protein GWN53_11110 [Gammaproteobacteria bacterium]|nr:hypothetical protein [Gammaproteobacteria bacterium]